MEGLKPDDAKFRKKKKNEPTHLAVQTCPRAGRRSRADGVGVDDVTTRADEGESAGEAGRTREGKTTRGRAGNWRYETTRGYVYMRENAARRTYQRASMHKLTGD